MNVENGLMLEITILQGIRADVAFQKACELAWKLNINIKFWYLGYECYVAPRDNWKAEYQVWADSYKSDHGVSYESTYLSKDL